MSKPIHQGKLRQINVAGQCSLQAHLVSETEELLLGRSSECQVILDFNVYGGVSRRHAVIRGIPHSTQEHLIEWQLCDLDSANGTFLNQVPIQGCQPLKHGDRIMLGKDGPEFIFECSTRLRVPTLVEEVAPESFLPQNTAVAPPAASVASDRLPLPRKTEETELSLSQIIPILGKRQELTQKAYWLPGALTIVLVVSLIVAGNIPALFNFLLALYLGCGGFYFIYRLCNKQKPWWVFAGCALGTILLLLSPIATVLAIVFRGILPGDIRSTSQNFLEQFVHHFFGAGLFEELLKILPVLCCLYWGKRSRSSLHRKIGIQEPADGIVLGAASALGFTLIETLGQYLPQVAQETSINLGLAAGELASLQLLIIRILASVSGHMAYSGYFGYFVGLSVLKPSKRWLILGIGYLTAAILHAFWNASALSFGPLALLLVGIVSYSFLISAILKAREISEKLPRL
jgi:RsiW-degrading membrane proteinase PrsW (M82 family)